MNELIAPRLCIVVFLFYYRRKYFCKATFNREPVHDCNRTNVNSCRCAELPKRLKKFYFKWAMEFSSSSWMPRFSHSINELPTGGSNSPQMRSKFAFIGQDANCLRQKFPGFENGIYTLIFHLHVVRVIENSPIFQESNYTSRSDDLGFGGIP